MTDKIQTIIYESDHTGHRLDYVSHLIRFVRNEPSSSRNTYLFLLHSELIRKLSDSGQYLQDLNIEAIGNLYQGNRWQNFLLLKDLRERLRTHSSCTSVALLNFDRFQYSLPIYPLNADVRTIWFRPVMHLPSVTFKDKLKAVGKTLLLNVIASRLNKSSKIFILNDSTGAKSLNQKYLLSPNKVFNFLPDPVDTDFFLHANPIDVRKDLKLDTGKPIFLMIGSIDEKKNVPTSLEALAQSAELTAGAHVLIVGKVNQAYREYLYNFIAAFKERNPHIEITTDDRYISQEEFHRYVLASTAILMIYRDFYSSSGIFGFACMYKKPVITSNIGLVGQLVKDFKIGHAADPLAAANITEKIDLLCRNQFTVNGDFDGYIRINKPEKFSALLLNRSLTAQTASNNNE
ncbi:hypothetical protein GCM10007423_64400 [Dyadobacter endophyticus]|uniref:Glycosyl transferase family 1 domain-containing protein n=1 Tax=Dyadobacter endophyticus TaxID=1749036 RepID=A0ABQ1ZCL8_9BACT|nr:glycosyltransferase [Dyadobacter endophyticus]GGH56134.1 hypothetical protein GCM10007423_64400 [Dyadobacter endophyticus]